MQIWLKNHNFFDIFYTSQKCSFISLCLDFTKFGTLPQDKLFRFFFHELDFQVAEFHTFGIFCAENGVCVVDIQRGWHDE